MRTDERINKKMYNLMSQALMAHYFNDWLGWFYPGYSGFHPQKEHLKRDQKEIKKKKTISLYF